MQKIIMLVSVLAVSALAEIQSITPKTDSLGCYRISTVEELYGFAELVNEEQITNAICAKLENDIIVNKNLMEEVVFSDDDSEPPSLKCAETSEGCSFEEWIPIGHYRSFYSNPFIGVFDGQGHTISGIYVNSPISDAVGFFGYVDGIVKNLNLADSYIADQDNFDGYEESIGGLIGRGGRVIYNCSFSGVVIGKYFVGGIVGRADGYTVLCHNDGYVWAKSRYAGGITGDGVVERCYNTGFVYAEMDAGGINGKNASINRSYNAGHVKGVKNIGGFVGSGGALIRNSFNVGQVSGKTNVGEFVGDRIGSVINSYSLSLVEEPNCKFDSLETPVYLEASAFTDGSLVDLLNNDGSFVNSWEQGDAYPVFRDYSPKLKNGVFQIENEEQLVWFWEADHYSLVDENVKAVLQNDLVFNKNVTTDKCMLKDSICDFIPWTPFGYRGTGFAGNFDGQFHTISGLYVMDTSRYSQALFNRVDEKGVVQNLIIKDSYFQTRENDNVSGVVVGNNYGTVSECFYKDVFLSESRGDNHYVVGLNYGIINETKTMNKDLWFDGKKLVPYKIKACLSAKEICEPEERFILSSTKSSYFIYPYDVVDLRKGYKYNDPFYDLIRTSDLTTIDSLGYLAFMYRLRDPHIGRKQSAEWFLGIFEGVISGVAKTYIDVSDANGFCATYMSDHDIVLETLNCAVTLPKTKKVLTKQFDSDDFKWTPSSFKWTSSSEKDSSVDCKSVFSTFDRFRFSISDTVETEGYFRLFEFGPKGTCKGGKKIAKEPEFCYSGLGNICEKDPDDERIALPGIVRTTEPKIEILGKSISFVGMTPLAKYQIVNLKGAKVKKGNVTPTVHLNDLKSGVYLIVVQDGPVHLNRVFLLKN